MDPAGAACAGRNSPGGRDYDFWATKVVGPAPLVEALLGDPEIEAVRLPWAH